MAKKLPSGLEELRKKGLITTGDDKSLEVRWVSTGIPQVDEMLGGGLPLDRVTLWVGEESAGKTLMSQVFAKSFQEQGLSVALVDAEMAYDGNWWRTTGVNPEELHVSRPASGEQAVDVITALIGGVSLIIIDSGAALVSTKAQEGSADDHVMSPVATIHQKLFNRINPRLPGSGTSIVMLNQIRANIGDPRPGAVSYPGGIAQKFWSSIITRVSYGGRVTGSGGEQIGVKVKMRTTKNKLARPQQGCEIPFGFDGQFDAVALIVSDAIDRRVIRHAGAFFRWDGDVPITDTADLAVKEVEATGERQVMGRDALHRLFLLNPAGLKAIEERTYAVAR